MTSTSPGVRSAAAIIIMWAATRGLLFASAWWGAGHMPSGRAAQSGNLQRTWEASRPLEIWARWDSEWYLLIAERGYHLEGLLEGKRVAYEPADATGFFPLYPLLARGGGAVLATLPGVERLVPGRAALLSGAEPATARESSLLLAAIVISNAALLGSLFLLYERVRTTRGAASRIPGEPPPDRAAMASCAALLCFPPSIFLSTVYAESLLLLLTLLCFKLLREGRWWGASIAGALASATKPSGLLLLIPAAVALLGAGRSASSRHAPPSGRRWLSLFFYPAGAIAFSFYCRHAFGDPLSWLHRQERWRGALSGPWRAFVRWAASPQVHGKHGSTVELIFALLALALLVLVFRRRPAAESAFASAVVLLPLCSTLWSFGRLELQAFPLFIALGGFSVRQPRWAALYFVPAIAGSVVLMAYFGAGWWAG